MSGGHPSNNRLYNARVARAKNANNLRRTNNASKPEIPQLTDLFDKETNKKHIKTEIRQSSDLKELNKGTTKQAKKEKIIEEGFEPEDDKRPTWSDIDLQTDDNTICRKKLAIKVKLKTNDRQLFKINIPQK